MTVDRCAECGTDVTRLETFYADSYSQLYHLRVHPIPPDGLYAFWDNNGGVNYDIAASATQQVVARPSLSEAPVAP